MSPKIQALADDLEAMRTEITELDAVEEPTEEQGLRYETLLTEWDVKKADHDKLVERAEKVEAVRTASLNVANVEEGTRFGAGVNVSVKRDPFENLESLRFNAEDRFAPHTSDDVIARAVTAITENRRGASDASVQSIVEKIETIPGVAQHALIHGSPAYRSAFQAWGKSQGQNALYTPEEQEAVRTAMSLTGANGGYTLPTVFDPTLIYTGAQTKNPIRQIARVVSGTQNVWHGVSVGAVTSYWTAEAAAMTEGSPTFSNPSVTAAKLTAYVLGSYEVFEDSNLLNELPPLIDQSFSNMESAAFISGSGSGAPRGIITAISATAGDLITATTRGTIGGPDIFAMSGALPSRYEDSAQWVANKYIYNQIQQLSTASSGALFWTNLNQSTPPELLGYPIYKSSTLPNNTTSGSLVAILGDFSQYLIYDRIGTTVEFVQNVFNSSALPTGQRALVAHKRVGGDVTDVNAFIFLKA